MTETMTPDPSPELTQGPGRANAAFPYTAEYIAGLFAKHRITPIRGRLLARIAPTYGAGSTLCCACGVGILLVDQWGWDRAYNSTKHGTRLIHLITLGLTESQYEGLMCGFDTRLDHENCDRKAYEVGKSAAKLVGLPADHSS